VSAAEQLGSGKGPSLAAPSVELHASFLAALLEYQAEGRHLELDAERLRERAEFARYVTALRADEHAPGEPDRYVERLTGRLPEEMPPGGYVPQTILWWVADDEYLGRVGIRHYLTDDLRRHGGHIGYEVRPSARRRGHATAMLSAALSLAAALGIDPAHIDCDVANVASRRVIEKNGGRLERVASGSLLFLVPTRRNG
jgi:predicted acetyltransferase